MGPRPTEVPEVLHRAGLTGDLALVVGGLVNIGRDYFQCGG
jgi:hypothetical protein